MVNHESRKLACRKWMDEQCQKYRRLLDMAWGGASWLPPRDRQGQAVPIRVSKQLQPKLDRRWLKSLWQITLAAQARSVDLPTL